MIVVQPDRGSHLSGVQLPGQRAEGRGQKAEAKRTVSFLLLAIG